MGKSYALFAGCAPKGVEKESLMSAVAVLKRLNVDFEELKEFSCCGAGNLEDVNHASSLLVNARNLAIAESKGKDIITICSTCNLELRKAKKLLDEDDELRESVNDALSRYGLKYEGKVEVKLFHQVLLSDEQILTKLKELIVRPLKRLRVYPFYGCHTIRPSYINDYENSENPNSLERLIKILGAEAVSGQRRILCCGFHAHAVAKEASLKLTGEHLKEAHDLMSDCLITPCPLCHMMLDLYQPDALSKVEQEFAIPVLHVQQLVGLAMGIDPEELGLHMNVVSALTLA